MASTIITYIDSALDDVELLEKADTLELDQHKLFRMLRFSLKNLKIFVLSARKLDKERSKGFSLRNFTTFVRSARKSTDDGRLRSLFKKMEFIVNRNAEKIHPHCPDLYGFTTNVHFNMVREFLKDMEDLDVEMDECYATMLFDDMPQSNSLTTDEVLEIISYILENIVDFCCLRTAYQSEALEGAMEAMGEQMKFLQSLIQFAAWRSSVKARRDLLAHAESVVINAASLLSTLRVEVLYELVGERKQLKVSTLLLKIKPSDLQVYKTYTQVLSGSKLPKLDVDDNVMIAMKNLIHSLISNLWEMLRMKAYGGVHMEEDELKGLYEGLRSLRTILKQQQQQESNFNLKMKKDIGAVLGDAGVIICSLYQPHVEVDIVGLRDLLKRIKIVLVELGEKDPQLPIFDFPMTDQLGFLDFLLERLMEFRGFEVRSIQEELVFLRSFLGEIMELRNEQKELQTLWDRVLEVASMVQCFIDHLMTGDHSTSSSASSFDSIIKYIRNIKADVMKISHGSSSRREITSKEVTRTYSHIVPSQRTPSMTNEVVGFDNDAKSIMERLVRGTKQLRIVAIVGMPGQGKTTLAAKVFNNPSISTHFSVHAWCPISQTLDKKDVLLNLLYQIDAKRDHEMNEQDLVEKLWKRLRGRRYLIFLDDLWSIEAWNSLAPTFPDDNLGSRILLTSRLHDVAPHHMLDQEPHFLRPLNVEQSLKLLQRKLFPGKEDWPLSLHDIGMHIVETCKGLPLSIVIIAGLLATIEPEDWKEVLDGLSSSITSTEDCMNKLELSYKHLPDYLRSCFLYFGAFPQDQEVSVRRLIRLWIAEGFVPKANKMKSAEDVAEDYLKDLIGRSLIIAAKQRSSGGIKTCRIHDLLHDFCLQKAKDEHFFHFLKGYDELLAFNEPHGLRRLCIQSEVEHFKQSKLFCPRARSLVFNCSQEETKRDDEEEHVLRDISFVIHIFKLLRVLDLEQIYLFSGFPSEVELLIQLAFLAIRGNISHIPSSSIAKLSNLETLIVDPGKNMLLLPDNLWDLQKLKYLYVSSFYHTHGGLLPKENLDSFSVLNELNRISGAVFHFGSSMERLMRKFPNIRKLKCKFVEYEDDALDLDKFVVPDLLSQLESLHIIFPFSHIFEFEFSLPANLKKLTLSSFSLPWSKISPIGKLPNLEVLKLLELSFTGETWEMEEGDFLKLRVLKLSSLDIVRWRVCDDQFDNFQKLILDYCIRLEEMPYCLGSTPTLESIEVSHCPKTVINLVRQIGEEQVDLGNSGLQIIIQSSQ